MAAAEMTESIYNVSPNLGGKTMKFKFTGVTTADWVIFPDPVGACYAILPTGAQATVAYAVGDVTATTVATATQTTVPYDGATAAQLLETDGFIMIDNEIIKYAAGGAAADGTLTGCSRGVFGTTAATHAENAVIYILNTLIFALGTTGLVRGTAEIIEE